jgi:hypothetical protein
MENLGAIITLGAFAIAVGALYMWGKREKKQELERMEDHQNPQKAA